MADTENDLVCFVHNVSPIKSSNNIRYFNLQLQMPDKITRAVNFSPEQKDKYDKLATSESPVKIQKFRRSQKYGMESIVLDKFTKVTEVQQSPSFIRSIDFDADASINVGQLQQVATEQLVNIRGKIYRLSAEKKQTSKSGTLSKQQGYLTDPSGFIKIILWEEYVNQVEEGKLTCFQIYESSK